MIEFLLVDDDNDDSDLIVEALNEMDIPVNYTYAMEGADAVKMIDGGYVPNIIFLDINMPGMDGWQCLKQFKSNQAVKDVPVIMYSTSSFQHEIDKAFELGALAFFTKPNHYSLLKKNICIVLTALQDNEINSLNKTVIESITPSERRP
ncbi:response regulator [uncultured Cytophaga sp.]|uniref:response regulator n=1 Tax=uncultured Cytophaga sp. TaxID=160238 RepID=UPI00262C508F|nr:response regulator [uncultured Cytophaga sp.]